MSNRQVLALIVDDAHRDAGRYLAYRRQDFTIALIAIRPVLMCQERRADAFGLAKLLLEDGTDAAQGPSLARGSASARRHRRSSAGWRGPHPLSPAIPEGSGSSWGPYG